MWKKLQNKNQDLSNLAGPRICKMLWQFPKPHGTKWAGKEVASIFCCPMGITVLLPFFGRSVSESIPSARLCDQPPLLELKIFFISGNNAIQVSVKWWSWRQCSQDGANINSFALEVRSTKMPQRGLSKHCDTHCCQFRSKPSASHWK